MRPQTLGPLPPPLPGPALRLIPATPVVTSLTWLLNPTSKNTVRWGRHVWSWRKISGHDFLVKGGPKADMRDITRAIIISHRVSTKDLFRYGWNQPSIHFYWNSVRVGFSSCQLNLIKTFQIEYIFTLITKISLLFLWDFINGQI